MRRSLVVGTIVVLVLTLALKPHPALAAAIPDPTTFWNALKVALGGATISSASVAAAGEFVAAGLIVGGVLVGGYLIVKAYQRWKDAQTSAGTTLDWLRTHGGTFSHDPAGSAFFSISGGNLNGSGCTPYAMIDMSPIYNGPGTANWQGHPWWVNFQSGCYQPSADAAYAWWLGQVGQSSQLSSVGPYWPGTTEAVPATVAGAIADPRWSTIAAQVAAQLDDALQADRDERAIPIPGNTDGYASPWGITFSNVRVGDQPAVGTPPDTGTPTANVTEGYMKQLMEWLAGVWRTQVQWLGGIIETWQSRVVTELQAMRDTLVNLPTQIADAVKVKVGEALQEAFVPQQVTLTQFEALRTTLATKPPFSLVPPAALFPDIAPGTCALPVVTASFMGSPMTLEWPSFICEYAGKLRVFLLGLFWVSIGLFVVGRVWPRVVF